MQEKFLLYDSPFSATLCRASFLWARKLGELNRQTMLKIIMIRTWTHSIVFSALLSASFYSASSHRAGATDVIITLAGGGSVAGYKPDEANLALASAQGLAI